MKGKSNLIAAVVVSLLVTLLSATAFAVPQAINYQGYIESGGAPVDGTVSMVFSIYNAPTGDIRLWTETQDVLVTDGTFGVVLGKLTSIALPFDEQYYLGVTVGEESEMTPRAVLVSVPYAMRTARVDVPLELSGATSADIINGVNTGTGRAGYFQISNPSSGVAAVKIDTDGGGTAIFVRTIGTGKGGYFRINNASNSSAALYAATNGSGYSGYFEGGAGVTVMGVMNVTGDLNVTGNITGDGSGLTGVPVGTHEHSGFDIKSDYIADVHIASTIARDSEIMPTVLANDGAGSTLDADRLDGQDSAAFAASAHVHSGTEITTGTVADVRVASTIARDTEIMPTVLANDGAGSTLDADRLDGQDSAAFAASAHGHSGADITSGTVADARVASTIARDAEIMPTVLTNDGAGSTLDADKLDGQQASEIIDAASDEVRTPISSLPVTISSSGSYYLTGDLNVTGTSSYGITVNADNVTIDLMGFTISGPGSGTGRGVYMNGRSNVEVRNGTVRNFGTYGINDSSTAAMGHRLINVRVVDNGTYGIYLYGKGHLVKDCAVLGNGGDGIHTGSGSTVTGNVAASNGGAGIAAGSSNTVAGNTAYYNDAYGIFLNGTYILVDGNTAYNNNQSGGSYTNMNACATCEYGVNVAP